MLMPLEIIIVDGARDAGSMSPILDMSLAELPSLEEIEFEPTPVHNPRLTQAQIRNALKDVFGNDIVVPTIAEPDLAIGGFILRSGRCCILTLPQRG